MAIQKLKPRPEIDAQVKAKRAYDHLEKLVDLLRKRDIPKNIIEQINSIVTNLNDHSSTKKGFHSVIKKKHGEISKLLEKELKIVPKNYYRNLWMALGMSVFGLPLGVAFGMALDNLALLGVGLPIGMAIGIGVGTAMDGSAAKEGRQLDIETKI